mmetsp:Transcript_507/g.445  ORF Transcript_507/g.445 Transcript_507/m.445 type:complete len:315 (-) Transcript_507:255-1199(-)|eukprot:CAMPEP_0205799664 /NCGR_PEP_ID=MMETSP0205-20121125/1027_1 /ASSEMBLY_ACC=CAM_ASM_000278 /TAXON_ID=36767 /ORGANISM="Euplotes focardii, Strain TN1" /LENGTH=314 /DNA_ID=CAMNT_0053061387 /DNA_START=303 /DNA_END=1247 /DNA_ORIENTATION=+
MSELDSCNNIVKLCDYNDDAILTENKGIQTPVFFMALEYCERGELFDLLAISGRVSEDFARYYFHQIIAGLEYMHAKGISHRDMKLENILVDNDYTLKIADFGYSSHKAKNESSKGTYGYMTPEIYSGEKYSSQSADLFAAAIILFILISHHPPFECAISNNPHYNLIRMNQYNSFWKVHTRKKERGLDFFSEDFRSLFMSMVAHNPVERPSLAEIKEHPWFKGPVPSHEDVVAEFQKRIEIYEASLIQMDQPVPHTDLDPDVYQSNVVHRSVGEESKEDDERKPAEYSASFKRYTEFFSTSSIEELFNTVAYY